ncbi:hypothetical protein EG68_11584 [Paragonimus skrjabini miyazakii]|uniref:CSD domain-containing protein n=1 Tax=Paragonimus skrjabini miyazakii TaxID=59628 RepID=A0A8S9YGT9_9TREM|nr:hypothetical protein EG68_11584 [Paragonimus skrjabini miyazakii]
MATAVEAPVENLKPQKKEVEVLKVIAEKVRGHVKWYSVSRRYGFISRNDDGGDLFVHRSVISSYSKRFPSLRNGEEVEFSVVETNQGIEATYVTGPGGQPVKGMRPLYRRYRTVSESNNEADPSQAQSEPVDEDAARPRQGGRRPRNFRRHDGGRVRSEGTTEVQVVEGDVEKQDKSDLERDGALAKTRMGADAEGEYPHDTVPRQRRRPQRRIPRHRSAPTEGPVTTEAHHSEDNGNSQAPEFHTEPTWQPRRFRRPFRPRGGFRSMNGTWNPSTSANDTNGVPHGYRNYQAGDRNGFDRGPRRRGYGGGHFRGQRRGPRPTGDWNAPTNGIPAATETDKMIAHDCTEHTVSVDDVANGIQQVELSASPKVSEESSGPIAVSNEA